MLFNDLWKCVCAPEFAKQIAIKRFSVTFQFPCLSITCGLQNSKLNRQMRFTLPSLNQMFDGSPQLTTTVKHCFVAWTVLKDLNIAHSAIVECWKEPAKIWLTVMKYAFVGWALNLRVRMLFIGASCVIRSFRCFTTILAYIYEQVKKLH